MAILRWGDRPGVGRVGGKRRSPHRRIAMRKLLFLSCLASKPRGAHRLRLHLELRPLRRHARPRRRLSQRHRLLRAHRSPRRRQPPAGGAGRQGQRLPQVAHRRRRQDRRAPRPSPTRRRRRRTSRASIDMKISLTGPSSHDLRVTYVTEAPSWKPSYRLTLARTRRSTCRPGHRRQHLGEDWQNVQLGVGSSSALSFRLRSAERPRRAARDAAAGRISSPRRRRWRGLVRAAREPAGADAGGSRRSRRWSTTSRDDAPSSRTRRIRARARRWSWSARAAR